MHPLPILVILGVVCLAFEFFIKLIQPLDLVSQGFRPISLSKGGCFLFLATKTLPLPVNVPLD